jgi:hypothetical protein
MGLISGTDRVGCTTFTAAGQPRSFLSGSVDRRLNSNYLVQPAAINLELLGLILPPIQDIPWRAHPKPVSARLQGRVFLFLDMGHTGQIHLSVATRPLF